MTATWLGLRTPFASGSILGLGGASLWYHDDQGPGEPLLLLGGFAPGHFHFDFVRPYLRDFRLITWEPRGFGPQNPSSSRPLIMWISCREGDAGALPLLVRLRRRPPFHERHEAGPVGPPDQRAGNDARRVDAKKPLRRRPDPVVDEQRCRVGLEPHVGAAAVEERRAAKEAVVELLAVPAAERPVGLLEAVGEVGERRFGRDRDSRRRSVRQVAHRAYRPVMRRCFCPGAVRVARETRLRSPRILVASA